MESGKLPDLQCAVCKQRGHGCHFGVVACRPCAAFFRRCIAENRSYKCLRGTNNCDIRRDGQRNACKACRLRLCRLVGMVYSVDKESSDQQQKQSENTQNECANSLDNAKKSDQFMENTEAGTEQLQPLQAMFQNSHHLGAHSITPTLDRFVRANDVFVAGQRSLFMALHPDAAFGNMMLVVPKHAEFVKMSQGTKPLLFGMLTEGIEPFSRMEHHMKLALLESTLSSLSLLHACHLTVSQFPQPGDTRYVTAVGHMLDSALLEQCTTAEWTDQGQNAPAEYIRIKKPLMGSWFAFIDSFRRFPIKVIQRDFCALSAITLWNIAQHQFGTMEASWRAHKEAIFAEWLVDLGSRPGGTDLSVHNSPALHMSRYLCTLVQLNSITTGLEEVSTILRLFQPKLHEVMSKVEMHH